MLIQIVRPTVARPNGQRARAVEPGELIDVDTAQAAQLIGLRKALAHVGAHSPSASPAPAMVAGDVMQMETPEAAMTPAERRERRKERGK